MKYFFSLVLFFGFLSQAQAGYEDENHTFTGSFALESCQPECAKIVTDLGAGVTLDFSQVEEVSISVVDKLSDFWKSCDAQNTFELNVRLFGRKMNPKIFMHNNMAWEPNKFQQICDSKFTSNDQRVTLDSALVKIHIEKNADGSFALYWSEPRLKFQGTFALKKTSDRP